MVRHFMPLRITLELVPNGNEYRKRKLAVVDIENDCTAHPEGAGPTGNYIVNAQGELRDAGWDDFAHVRIVGLKRGDYMDTAIECMTALHSKNWCCRRCSGPISSVTEYQLADGTRRLCKACFMLLSPSNGKAEQREAL
jgi:hypothetical protein